MVKLGAWGCWDAGGGHCWNGWVKWAFYWGLSLANLTHVTAQPDLLPWNATGCCAGDKKRQRLKLQGGNTLWSWRAAQLRQEKKKSSQAFSCTPLSLLPSTALHIYPPPTVATSSSYQLLWHTCTHSSCLILEDVQCVLGDVHTSDPPLFLTSSSSISLPPVSGLIPAPAPQ